MLSFDQYSPSLLSIHLSLSLSLYIYIYIYIYLCVCLFEFIQVSVIYAFVYIWIHLLYSNLCIQSNNNWYKKLKIKSSVLNNLYLLSTKKEKVFVFFSLTKQITVNIPALLRRLPNLEFIKNFKFKVARKQTLLKSVFSILFSGILCIFMVDVTPN